MGAPDCSKIARPQQRSPFVFHPGMRVEAPSGCGANEHIGVEAALHEQPMQRQCLRQTAKTQTGPRSADEFGEACWLNP
jgi:hypothetical protein